MGIATDKDEFVKNLTAAIGIPPNCKAFEIRVAAGEAVSVKCLFFAEQPVDEPVWKQYELHEVDDKCQQ